MRDVPEHVANTLENILNQLDMLTQTVSILEERMTLVENVLTKPVDRQRQVRDEALSSTKLSSHCR